MRETKPEPGQEKFKHKKSLGQNFLTSDIVPNWLCEAGAVTQGDLIFEIGPGEGRLTKELLKRQAKVISVEADSRAILILEKTFASELSTGQLVIHHGDAREITPLTLGFKDHEFKIVANIPYYLSGNLLRTLLESSVQPETLVFLMQKEMVTRITRDKKSSLLSLSVSAFGQPSYAKTVSRGHFNPIPNVDSAILAINHVNRDNFSTLDPEYFFKILHLGLGKKRKQLIHNLSHEFKREEVATLLINLDLTPAIRGEDIDLPTWLKLATALQQLS